MNTDYENFRKNMQILLDIYEEKRELKHGPEKTWADFLSALGEHDALRTLGDMVLSKACFSKDGRISRKNRDFFLENYPGYNGMPAEYAAKFYRSEWQDHRNYSSDAIHSTHLDQIAAEARKYYGERRQR